MFAGACTACYNLDHVCSRATLIPFSDKKTLLPRFSRVQDDKISFLLNKQQTIEWDSERATAFTCLKHFSRLVEMARPRFDRATPHQQASSLPSASTAQGTGKYLDSRYLPSHLQRMRIEIHNEEDMGDLHYVQCFFLLLLK